MRLLASLLLAVVFILLAAPVGFVGQHVPAYGLWVATPTDFLHVPGSAPITSSKVFQVESLAILKSGSVTCVTFNSTGTLLAANGDDNSINIYDVQTGRLLKSLPGSARNASQFAFTPDGNLLAAAYRDALIRLWDIITGEEASVLRGHTGELSSIAVSPDGEVVASGSVYPDSTLRIWDMSSYAQTTVLKGEDGEEFFDIAFSPDGTLLAAATGSVTYGKVRLWDVETWTLLATLEGYSNIVSGITFSHDGTFLITASYDGTIKQWTVGSSDDPVVLHRYDEAVYSIDLNPDDTLLAVGLSESTIRLWDLTSERELVSLEGYKGPVWSVAFSPDGRLLASGSMYPDRMVKLWGIP